ncbi:MAG: ABC transporter substrate-binding protein [Candidatus Aminicenantes bacterium]
MRKLFTKPLFLLLGIGLATTAGCRSPQHKGLLIIGLSQTVSTLDPAMHRDRVVETVIRNMFDGLVTRTPDMKVVPQMAEKWRLVDKNTWEFKLRKGIRFHNLEPFTAEDVKFTIERIITRGAVDGQSSPRKGLLGPVTGVDIIDHYTVHIKTSEPWPTLIAMLPFQEIIPKDYVEKVGSSYFAEHPVGAGPFRFVEWRKGEHIIMERFDQYYGGSPEIPPAGKARIKTLIFRPIPETATRVAALKAGECDLIQMVPPHLMSNIAKDPRTRILSCRGTRSFYMGMNCTRPPFDDPRVRRAMNHAVDIDSIINTILEGMAVRLPGPLMLGSFGYHDDLRPYQHNPQKARRLLKEAGYENGLEVELDTVQDLNEIALALSAQLARVKVKAKVRLWEWGVLRTLLMKQERTLFISSWGDASLDSIGILKPTLHSKGRGNYTGYSNPAVDHLLEKAEKGMDTEKRKQFLRQAQHLIFQDAPWIFGYSMKEIYGARKRLKGWRPIPDGRMNMHDVFTAVE